MPASCHTTADLTCTDDGEAAPMTELQRWNVGARKIPYVDRDVAHAVITPDDPRGYRDLIRSDDDTVPDGTDTTYSVLLTEEEAERFAQASNARFVEADQAYAVPEPVEVVELGPSAASAVIPEHDVMVWLGADKPPADGTDVIVAVIDGGTTRAVRDAMGFQLVARRNFSGEIVPDDNTITTDHGCLAGALAVPRGGQLVDAIVFDRNGSATWSGSAAAMRWCVDQGAQVLNYSAGGDTDSNTMRDALQYVADRGAVAVISAGNGGRADYLSHPARLSEQIRAVKSSIAFTFDRMRASFSDHKATGSGCAPGERVLTLGADGLPRRASGTSFSSPLMAQLIALAFAATGGRHPVLEVAEALERTALDTAEPDAEEGAGAWNLDAALATLAPAPPAPLFYSSRRGRTFHRLTDGKRVHRWVRRHQDFFTRQEALDAGLRPCGWCRP